MWNLSVLNRYNYIMAYRIKMMSKPLYPSLNQLSVKVLWLMIIYKELYEVVWFYAGIISINGVLYTLSSLKKKSIIKYFNHDKKMKK